MLQLLPLALAAALVQDPIKSDEPSDDDVVVRGLPDGDLPPLPNRVDWDLDKAIVARTATRERIDLTGFWRFAAVPERDAPVARNDMGWLAMPRRVNADGQAVFDAQFRPSNGVWRDKPLERHPYVWAERDIQIRNDRETLTWLNRRIYLVLRGPWADAEIYLSQRIPPSRSAERNSDVPPDVYVNVEQVAGRERDGYRWCEISEQLIYPGTTQISLRLQQNVAKPPENSTAGNEAEPYVGLELTPTGPRIETIRLRRDSENEELEATLELVRPKGFMIIPGPPVRTIPMTLKLRLDDAETDTTIQRLDRDIGPITDNERTVTLRIPWSAKDQPPPERARFRVRLAPTMSGGTFDEPFPVEFNPAELMPVD